MKHLDSLDFRADQCRKELTELEALLAANTYLKESRDILPFFRARRHLSAFLGSRDPNIFRFDRIAYEYDLFGDFSCDLVVGDSITATYGFIEFEDASPRSIFVRRSGRATPAWSSRFDRGMSQIIDWFYKVEDMEKSDEFEARFGAPKIHFFGLLVIGRSEGFLPRELKRLVWRQDRVVVNSRYIRCLTYDQLAEDLAQRLQRYVLADHVDT